MSTKITRQYLHQVIDRIPDEMELQAAMALLWEYCRNANPSDISAPGPQPAPQSQIRRISNLSEVAIRRS